MSLWIVAASLCFFGCQQQNETLNAPNYQETLPNVVIRRSAFDYPEGFQEIYLQSECHDIPDSLKLHKND